MVEDTTRIVIIFGIAFLGLTVFAGLIEPIFNANLPTTTTIFRLVLGVILIGLVVNFATGMKNFLETKALVVFGISTLAVILLIVFFPNIVGEELSVVQQAVQSMIGVTP